MAVTDAQIRAVLAANPNASDERILKALANYGVSPTRFIAVTGRKLEPFSTLLDTMSPSPTYSEQPPSQTPFASQATAIPVSLQNPTVQTPITIYEPPTIYEPLRSQAPTGSQAPALPVALENQDIQTAKSPGLLSDSPIYEQPPSLAPTGSQAPVTKTIPTATASGVPYSRIKTALERNPNATPDQIANVMVDYGITPDDMRRVLGQSFAANTDIRQAYGQAGGYTDQQIRDAVMGRAETKGFATQPEIQKAAQNYGITPEQLARVFPQVQPGSLNQIPITTSEFGLPAAVSAIGRAADVTRETSEEGQKKLVNRIKQIGQAVGGIYDEAQGYQQTYRDLGQEAAQRQAALTGALGPDAQAQAFAEYQASPALDYLQRQSERALTRQAAAMGGLGGGNVRQDLVKLTADLYGQDYANQFARLGEIAQRGYGASGTSAQLGGQEAGTISGLGQAGAITAAQMQDALSGRLGNLLGTEAQYRLTAGQDVADVIRAGTTGISGLQVGASDAYRNIYGNLTDAQLQTAKDLATQYGNSVANQYLAEANAYQNKGAALGGVPGQAYTPLPTYNIGGALQAGGRAVDLANSMFGGNQNSSLSGNMQYFPGGPTTRDLIHQNPSANQDPSFRFYNA